MHFLFAILVAAALQGATTSPTISNHNIRAFAEDSDGHIWIGTFRGLNKYHIQDFHQYFWQENPESLPDNQINSLLVDMSGRLWAGTVFGVAYYTDRDRFQRIRIPEGVTMNNYRILENSSGTVIFVQGNDILVHDPQEESLRTVVKGVIGPEEMGPGYHIDNRDRLWVVTTSRIRCIDSRSFSLLSDTPNTLPSFHSCLTSDGKIWMAGMKQLGIYDTISGRFQDLPACFKGSTLLKDADVTNIFEADRNQILLTTFRHGTFLYDSKSGRLLHQSEDGFPFDMPEFAISAIFKDSQQNIWFGSEDKGFAVNYHYKDQFNSNRFLTSAFNGKSVVSLASGKEGDLFISTRKEGLFHYSPSQKRVLPADMSLLFGKDIPGEIVADVVFVDSRNHVWILSRQHLAAFRCNFSGERLTPVSQYFIPSPMCITEDREGVIWIGSATRDIYRIGPGEARAAAVNVLPNDGENTWVTAIVPAGDGKLLVSAFRHPLTVLDTRTGKASPAIIDTDDLNACLKRSVFIPSDVLLDSGGDLWIATIANGLLHYSLKDKRLTPVPGVPCSDIESLEEDNQGNVWIGTLAGLGKYDRSVGALTNYSAGDGIGGDEFFDRASCKLPDGTMVFGGNHGLTVFNPLDVPLRRTVPFVFEELRVHNTPILPGDGEPILTRLALKPEVVLHRNQNSFGVSFAALDWSETQRTIYSHILEGFDRYWTDGGSSNEVYYANVPPGKYKLRVRISNSNKSIVETEDSISIRVLPTIWETWWMITLYFILGIGALIAILFILRARELSREAVRKAQEEKEQERRMGEMNAAFFSNIAHEFRTPLTMISGPVTQIAESPGLSDENHKLMEIVKRSVARMLRLVNQIMDLGRLQNASLNLKVRKADVTGVIRKYIEIFQYNADNRGIELRTYGLEEPFLMWIDEDKLEKILANLLSNAMKYTPTGGQVTVSFDLDENDPSMAKIVVADTGAGIPEDKLEIIFDRYYQLSNQKRGSYGYSTGIGLYYARSLATIHHGTLRASNAVDGHGAQFTLRLPVAASAYTEEERTPLEETGPRNPLETVPSLKSDVPAAADDDNRPTVMAIDDDSEVLQYLRALLDATYNVVSCFSADSALRKIHEQAPDIILSDVVMPGMTGYELCREIKSDVQLSHIPVILITAKGSISEQVEGLDAGADAYVTKPFDPSYLKALLKSQLDNRAKVRSRLNAATSTDDLHESELSPQDVAFMERLYKVMDEELSNPELDINKMARLMAMSRTKFYYKVKGLTGENPSVFFKNYKLNRAAELLLGGQYNMSEIADMTGFSTLSHFSTSFKKKFGVPPSEYRG